MEQDILDRLYFGKIVPWENRRGNTPEMDSLQWTGGSGHRDG